MYIFIQSIIFEGLRECNDQYRVLFVNEYFSNFKCNQIKKSNILYETKIY
jgi:hypothetical protein